MRDDPRFPAAHERPRVRGRPARRARVACPVDARDASLDAGPAPLRDHRLRLNAYTADRGRPASCVEEHTEETTRARGGVRRAHGPRDVHARRRGARRAGRHRSSTSATRRSRRGAVASRAGHDRARVRRQAAARHERLAWEISFAAYGYLNEGDPERGLRRRCARGLPDEGPDDGPRLLYDLACFGRCRADARRRSGACARAVELDAQSAAVQQRRRGPRRDPRRPALPRQRSRRRRAGVARRPARGTRAPGRAPAGRRRERRRGRARERVDDELEAGGERERLVRLLAAERDELLRARGPRSRRPR